VRPQIRELRKGSKVVDFKELLAPQHRLTTLAVCAPEIKVAAQEWTVPQVVAKRGWLFLARKLRHASIRGSEASEQFLDLHNQFAAVALPAFSNRFEPLDFAPLLGIETRFNAL